MLNYAQCSDQRRRSSRLIGIMFGSALLAASGPAYGGAPTVQIQSAVEKVLVVLRDGELQPEAKRKELREAIYPKFDFAEMARRSLGNHWPRRNAQEQQEFVKVFSELVENSYMTSIESYSASMLPDQARTVRA